MKWGRGVVGGRRVKGGAGVGREGWGRGGVGWSEQGAVSVARGEWNVVGDMRRG